MPDLTLKETLNLKGSLTLKGGGGGKVIVGTKEALVEVMPSSSNAHGAAPPVLVPPPPAPPAFPQPDVWIVTSFNKTVKAGSAYIVAQGMAMQGQAGAPWPGMVLPSSVNQKVKINNIPINVVGDSASIFPSGGPASFTKSGQ